MRDQHLSGDELEQYVIGALPSEQARALEAHAAACAVCAKGLQAEAALELRLYEVGSTREAPVALAEVRRRRAGDGWALGGGLAAAALVLLLARPMGVGGRERPVHPLVVDCGAAASLDDCVARAHYSGLMVRSPPGAAEVPRYEELTDMGAEGAAFVP